MESNQVESNEVESNEVSEFKDASETASPMQQVQGIEKR